MKHIVALLAFLLVHIAASAQGAFWTADAVHAALKEYQVTPGSPNAAFALGYVIGIADMGAGTAFCPSRGTTQGQVVQVVFIFMERHPEMWNYAADSSVRLALSETWGCKSKP